MTGFWGEGGVLSAGAAGATLVLTPLGAGPARVVAVKIGSQVSGAGSVEDAREGQSIEAARRGDHAAYGYLVEKHLRKVVSVAWTIVRNHQDAEDLAQEALVRAFQKLDQFRPGEPFGPWIYRIVTNLALDHLKRRRRYQQEELDEEQPGGADTSQAARANQMARRIDQALEALPEMQKIVARLYLVEEFDHAEIAAMTRLTEGTVRSHLSHARKKLQAMLEDLHGGTR